ncbi:testis-expressed protein 51 isoform X7 [Canis lupus dingo]|uniref:testis-expressed protein 51 isoform X7 n=1 Tax=Canis lupus dingo TaxID=286419 RepID=UPI0020C4A988|nr:testis-expressed protein 51 isoform X7 [Canis lupus dingo]
MLLLLLGCLLPPTNGKSCLHCWPELPPLIDYDLQILWGTPGPPAELSQSVHSLFLKRDRVFLEPQYLDQDHMEEATAKLFNHIDETIKKFRDDKPSLLEEIGIQKQVFTDRLNKISEELKERAPFLDDTPTLPSSVCLPQHLSFSTISPSWAACNKTCDRTRSTVTWVVSLGIILLLAAIAGSGWYIFWREKRKEAEKVLGTETPARM